MSRCSTSSASENNRDVEFHALSPIDVGEQAFLSPWGRLRERLTTGRLGTAVNASAWSFGGYVAAQLLRTISTVILARHFLGPEAFGVVGLVGVFLAGLTMFSELGILANIVQHPRGDDQQFLNTAFSVQLVRGVLIWSISAAAAYPLSVFYRMPEILPLLLAAGSSEMLRGMISTSMWTFTRHVKLRSVTLLTIGSEVIAFAACVLWAVISPSAWALVVRTIVAAAVMAAGSHLIAKPRIRLGWDPSAARDILHFGGWVSVATAAYFLGSQGERLFLGKFITPAELGCFSLAIMVSSVPSAGIGQLVNQIFLPMISQTVRTSHHATVADFRRARLAFLAIAIFAALGFVLFGNLVVALFLNPKYKMTGWMLQLLGMRVALDLFAAPSSNLIMAFGRPKYSATANVTRLVLMVSGLWYCFTLYGIREAIFALLGAQALSYFPLIAGIKKLVPEVAASELRLYSLLVFFLTAMCAIFLRR